MKHLCYNSIFPAFVSQTSGQEGIVNVAHVKILSAEEAESVSSNVDALVKSLNDVKQTKDDNKHTCLTDK